MNKDRLYAFNRISKSLKNCLKITILPPFNNDKLRNSATNLPYSHKTKLSNGLTYDQLHAETSEQGAILLAES